MTSGLSGRDSDDTKPGCTAAAGCAPVNVFVLRMLLEPVRVLCAPGSRKIFLRLPGVHSSDKKMLELYPLLT